ncbi:ribosome biogenesis protein NIP7, partial [Aduncisulcus paluster]
MRKLSKKEAELFFSKLSKFIGSDVEKLLKRSDDPHSFMLIKDRVFYMRNELRDKATIVDKKLLKMCGVCFGKFTHGGNFHLHITALPYIAQYAKYRVWVKAGAELSFLYKHNIPKAGLVRMTENTPRNQGVVVYNAGDQPIGFGITARSSSDVSVAEPASIVVLHQEDLGIYIRDEEVVKMEDVKRIHSQAKEIANELDHILSRDKVDTRIVRSHCDKLCSLVDSLDEKVPHLPPSDRAAWITHSNALRKKSESLREEVESVLRYHQESQKEAILERDVRKRWEEEEQHIEGKMNRQLRDSLQKTHSMIGVATGVAADLHDDEERLDLITDGVKGIGSLIDKGRVFALSILKGIVPQPPSKAPDSAVRSVRDGRRQLSSRPLMDSQAISKEDEEWTLDIPIAVRQKMARLSSELKTVKSLLLSIGGEMDGKVTKIEMSSILQHKEDRKRADDRFIKLREELDTMELGHTEFATDMTDQLESLQLKVSKLREGIDNATDLHGLLRGAEERVSGIDRNLRTTKGSMQETLDKILLKTTGIEKELLHHGDRTTGIEKELLHHGDRVAFIDSQSSALSTRIETLKEETTTSIAAIRGSIDPIKALSLDLTSRVDRLEHRLGEGLKETQEKIEAYCVRVFEEEKRAREEDTEAVTGRHAVIEETLCDLKKMLEDLNTKVDTQLQEHSRMTQDMLEQTRLEMRREMDAASDRLGCLNKDIEQALLDQRNFAGRIAKIEQDTQMMSRRIKDDAISATVAVKKVEVDLKKHIDETIARLSMQLQQTHDKLKKSTGEFRRNREEWDTKWKKRVVEVNGTISDIRLRIGKLGDDLDGEKESRTAALASLEGRMAELRQQTTKNLATKAAWNDVRRALWLKADKADLPIAMSVQGADLPSSGRMGRTIVDSPEPPEPMGRTVADLAAQGSRDPLGHAIAGSGNVSAALSGAIHQQAARLFNLEAFLMLLSDLFATLPTIVRHFRYSSFDMKGLVPFSFFNLSFEYFIVFRLRSVLSKLTHFSTLPLFIRKIVNVIYIVLVVLCLFAGIFRLIEYEIYDVQELSFLSGIYFTTATITTIGYGDVSPQTQVGRLVVILFIYGTIFLMPFVVSKLSDIPDMKVLFGKIQPKKPLPLIVVFGQPPILKGYGSFLSEFFHCNHGIRKERVLFVSGELKEQVRMIITRFNGSGFLKLDETNLKDIFKFVNMRYVRGVFFFSKSADDDVKTIFTSLILRKELQRRALDNKKKRKLSWLEEKMESKRKEKEKKMKTKLGIQSSESRTIPFYGLLHQGSLLSHSHSIGFSSLMATTDVIMLFAAIGCEVDGAVCMLLSLLRSYAGDDFSEIHGRKEGKEEGFKSEIEDKVKEDMITLENDDDDQEDGEEEEEEG